MLGYRGITNHSAGIRAIGVSPIIMLELGITNHNAGTRAIGVSPIIMLELGL